MANEKENEKGNETMQEIYRGFLASEHAQLVNQLHKAADAEIAKIAEIRQRIEAACKQSAQAAAETVARERLEQVDAKYDALVGKVSKQIAEQAESINAIYNSADKRISKVYTLLIIVAIAMMAFFKFFVGGVRG